MSKVSKQVAPVEVEIEVKPLPINRDNLTFIASGLWHYQYDGKLEECEIPGGFISPAASDFSIRLNDVVICSNGAKAVLVVVQKK